MKSGILLVAHGFSSIEKDDILFEISESVSSMLGSDKFAVRGAFLGKNPTISGLLEEFKAEGISDVLVLPIFIGISQHTLQDIPAILGTYFNPGLEKKLIGDGNKSARKLGLKITSIPSLAESGILADIMLDEIKNYYVRQERNSIIILAQGSKDFKSYWDKLFFEIERNALKKIGPMKLDVCYIGFGSDFSTEAMPLIEKRLDSYDNVSIIGMYAFLPASEIVDYHLKMNRLSPESVDTISDKRVRISPKCILPHPKVTEYFVAKALEFSNSLAENE